MTPSREASFLNKILSTVQWTNKRLFTGLMHGSMPQWLFGWCERNNIGNGASVTLEPMVCIMPDWQHFYHRNVRFEIYGCSSPLSCKLNRSRRNESRSLIQRSDTTLAWPVNQRFASSLVFVLFRSFFTHIDSCSLVQCVDGTKANIALGRELGRQVGRADFGERRAIKERSVGRKERR